MEKSEELLNESENENVTNDSDDDDEEETMDNQERVPIDLSENEIYRGVCTLLEDEDGNNILEYISLLHTELIGINKSLENLRLIRKDITRLADCAELIVKSNKGESLDVPVKDVIKKESGKKESGKKDSEKKESLKKESEKKEK